MTILPSFFSSQFARARGLPLSAKVALFLFFTAGFADGVLVPFFALWAQREGGVATAHIGLLLGCYAGGELLATPLVGGIADRVGRRPVLLVSTLGVGLGFGLLYLTRGGCPRHLHGRLERRQRPARCGGSGGGHLPLRAVGQFALGRRDARDFGSRHGSSGSRPPTGSSPPTKLK